MNITYTLNLQGEACPYPAIATLDALPQLKSGEILEVLAIALKVLIQSLMTQFQGDLRCLKCSKMVLPYAL